MDINLKIEGMTCGGCKAAVERILKAQPGVSAVTVDLANGSAAIKADTNSTPQALAAAVTGAGYEAQIAAS